MSDMAVRADMGADVSVERRGKAALDVTLENYWTIECLSPPDDHGVRKVKWRHESVPNVVMNEGKSLLLDIAFQGTAKPTWYVRLIDDGTTTPAATETLSTLTVAEFLRYTQGGTSSVGGAVTFAAASVGSAGSAAAVVFTLTAAGTVRGAMLATTSTGTGGRLYGVVDFTGGNRTVSSGDVLNVSVATTAS